MEVYYAGTEEQWDAIPKGSFGNNKLKEVTVHYESTGFSAISGDWGGLSWSLDASGQLTISGSGAMNDFEWNSVVAWKEYSLNIQSVTIENGITSVGAHAFSGCGNLTAITLPDGITSVGSYAFGSCGSLIEVLLPISVSSIGSYAFSENKMLKRITIPEGITDIGYKTFYACSALTEVTIPKGVTRIDDYAFYACRSLTSITLPKSLTDIGDSAFGSCEQLRDIYFGGTAEQWRAIKETQKAYYLMAAEKHYGSTGPDAQ